MMNPLKAAAEVARFLDMRRVPYFVIGGIALQYWGEPRLTRDVDITVLVASERLESFVEEVLLTFAPRLPQAREFALQNRVLLVQTEEGVPADISLGIPGYEEHALKRAIIMEIPEAGSLRIASAEDLIIHKCVAGRARDVEDVESILIRQRLNLDTSYIRKWLEEFAGVVETHNPLGLFEEALERAKKSLSDDI